MAMKFEDLRVLQTAEAAADGIWQQVVRWDAFSRDTVGRQLTRAADSIGANIAEAFGRFHFGEKLQFLYYARGSLFETKYWLNRALARELMPAKQVQNHVSQLTELARQLNAFAATLKVQRRGGRAQSKAIREVVAEYVADLPGDASMSPFTKEELEWVQSIPNT